MIPTIIRERTLKGIFARQGSSGTRARRYDRRYARRVGKSVGGPVDLWVTGQLISSIVGTQKVNKFSATAGAKITGSDAKRKFEYIQVDGIGPRLIKRRFMYLRKGEAQRIMRAMIRAGTFKK